MRINFIGNVTGGELKTFEDKESLQAKWFDIDEVINCRISLRFAFRTFLNVVICSQFLNPIFVTREEPVRLNIFIPHMYALRCAHVSNNLNTKPNQMFLNVLEFCCQNLKQNKITTTQ